MTEVRAASAQLRSEWITIPTPGKLEAYEQASPGTANRLVAILEANQAHARRIEAAALRIRCLGYVLAFISVAILSALAMFFANVGAPTQGAAIVVTGAASIAGIFVTGRVVGLAVSRRAPAQAHGGSTREG
jgi:uncharacterized membrane protein